MIRIVEYVFWQWIKWRSFHQVVFFTLHNINHQPSSGLSSYFFAGSTPMFVGGWFYEALVTDSDHAKPRCHGFHFKIISFLLKKHTFLCMNPPHPPPSFVGEIPVLQRRFNSICCVAFFTSSSKGVKVGQRSCAKGHLVTPGECTWSRWGCSWLFPIFQGMKLLEVSEVPGEISRTRRHTS